MDEKVKKKKWAGGVGVRKGQSAQSENEMNKRNRNHEGSKTMNIGHDLSMILACMTRIGSATCRK